MARRRRLSAHFTPAEFDCRDGTRFPPSTRPQLLDLVRRFLEPLRDEFGAVTILSAYRTKSHNARVGGASQSYHVWRRNRRGVAVDLKCRTGTPGQWAAFLEQLDPGGLGRYPGHVHVDNRPGRARWSSPGARSSRLPDERQALTEAESVLEAGEAA